MYPGTWWTPIDLFTNRYLDYIYTSTSNQSSFPYSLGWWQRGVRSSCEIQFLHKLGHTQLFVPSCWECHPHWLHDMDLLSASKVRWLELSQLSLCSEFDKENLMEFSLISLPTYTLYYCGYALIFPWSSCYSSHVTPCDCDLWRDHPWPFVTPMWHCDKVTWYFPTLHLIVVSPKKKKKKRKEI